MAKKAKKKAAPKEEFFVAMNDPHVTRVSLLEARRKTLESMRVFQELKELRKQKIHEKSKLRKNLKHISATINKIKKTMPHINLPSEPKPKPVKKIVQIEKKPATLPPKPRSELDRIEDGLADIESKLAHLS
ncbi:hypothetical protein GOV09_07115 [Candidatus Woesearchaeota archaeon]|nr:hypothetical protein [Candidatus Woesearchaeota archaeon]